MCIRDKVLSLILYLNNLQNFCNREIENCILAGDQSCAVLLQGKALCVTAKKEILQKVIAQVDEVYKNNNEQDTIHVELKAEKIINDIENDLVFSNHVKVLKDNLKEQGVLRKALKKFEIDEIEVESKIKSMIDELQTINQTKRYKYRRSKPQIS
jgi:hypothetical protein